MECKRLGWDSEFFGFGIGRVELEGATPEALAELEERARAEGIVCLYASVDPADIALATWIQKCGYLLVEVAMDLLHPTSIIEKLPTTSATARFGSLDDLAALEEEIVLMAPWSRFAVDPRFEPDAASRMHRAWVERAAGPGEDRRLVVAEDASGIIGFSTLSMLEGQEPRIDLIASSRSGSGAAYALVDFEFHAFGDRRSWGGPIAARNIASLRFCEHMGYRVGTVRYLYHRWLDET